MVGRGGEPPLASPKTGDRKAIRVTNVRDNILGVAMTVASVMLTGKQSI